MEPRDIRRQKRDASPTFIIMCVTFNEKTFLYTPTCTLGSDRTCRVNKTRHLVARELILRCYFHLRTATLKRRCFRRGSMLAHSKRLQFSLMATHVAHTHRLSFWPPRNRCLSWHINWSFFWRAGWNVIHKSTIELCF